MTADDALTPQARRELEAMDAALAGRPVEPELTELGALALALRDGRPEPRPAFTRELDARAAAGFSRRRRFAGVRERLSGSMLLVPGTALAAVLALVVTVALIPGGSSDIDQGGSGGGGGGSSAGQAAPSAADESAQRQSAPSRQSMPNAATGPVAPPSSGSGAASSDGRDRRFVERSAALILAAKPADIDRTAAEVVRVTERLGGFVASQSVTSGANGGGGDFLLRVPTARLSDALSQLSRVSAVRERSQNAQDITAERVSAADRLRTARAYRRSLLRRLAAATTDAETQELQDRLDGVNRRIAGFRASLSRVDNRARYANVDVTLVADRGAGGAAPAREDRWSPGDAAKDALRVLEVAAGVLLVAAAVALPLGLLIATGIGARQLAVRRSRQRVLDAV